MRESEYVDIKPMNINLDADVKALLQDLAKKRRTSPSKLVQEWVLRECGVGIESLRAASAAAQPVIGGSGKAAPKKSARSRRASE